MSSFTDPLVVEKVKNRLWKVSRTFTYFIGSEDSAEYVSVPKGTMTDFASSPRVFWIIFPPDGQYTQAAVLHDYLYQTQPFSRKRADKIFLEAMGVLGVKWWVRYTKYLAVRAGARVPWKNYALKKKEASNEDSSNSVSADSGCGCNNTSVSG